jgi:3-phosphoshikimate 1-carboxyvinyltransferase
MMIAPYLKGGLELKLTGDIVSSSYIRLTAGIMQDCGADVRISDNNIKVNEGSYLPSAHPVEPDWSSASYWYQMAALSDDPEIFLSDFRENSLQGDHFTAQLFNWMGVHTSYSPGGITLTRQKRSTYPDQEIDFSSTPDLVPAYLAACAALGVNARLKGVGHLRFKESDRIEALGKELAKIGAQLKGEDNTIEFIPGQLDLSQEPEFDTYGDHRMAMCMAPLALKFPSVTINDPEVVEKSYPEFWSDLAKTGVFSVEKK